MKSSTRNKRKYTNLKPPREKCKKLENSERELISSLICVSEEKRKRSDNSCAENATCELPSVKSLRSFSSSTLSDKTSVALKEFQFNDDKFPFSWKESKIDKKLKISSSSLSLKNSNTACDGESSSFSSKLKYTPLEEQYLNFKNEYSDSILFIQHGYRYRFFGRDAEIASSEFNIVGHVDHNFVTASIPLNRLNVYIKILTSKGYKCRIIKQTETSALKNETGSKNSLFERKLTATYTKATLVGEDFEMLLDNSDDLDVGRSNEFILCLCEHPNPKFGMEIGLLAVDPSMGDTMFDHFWDDDIRTKLEQRLLLLKPSEVIIPSNISKITLNLIKSHLEERKQRIDHSRLEVLDEKDFDYSQALILLSDDMLLHSDVESSCLRSIMELPKIVVECYVGMTNHLKTYNLETILKFSNFVQLNTSDTYMNVNYVSRRNLELFENNHFRNSNGTLWSIINKTKTRFGSRLLMYWLCYPLKIQSEIHLRLDAITEIINSKNDILHLISRCFHNLPDLEKIATAIFYAKTSTKIYLLYIKSLKRIYDEFKVIQPAIDVEIKAELILKIIKTIIEDLSDIDSYISEINEDAARDGNKCDLFKDSALPDEMRSIKSQIHCVETKLHSSCEEISKILQISKFEFVTVSGQEYLIEVKNQSVHLVPDDWLIVMSTKYLKRFRTPKVIALMNDLCVLKEKLNILANENWIHYLRKFSINYVKHKNLISGLAKLDCLFSLAQVACRNNFCKPNIAEENHAINIKNGFNPIVYSHMESMDYVKNSTELDKKVSICQIITGPNMGGKSSYVRQVAVNCLLAQIGSYVPAEEATLPILDGLYTRMGASDNIFQNSSSFMTEMRETSEIFRCASSNSLVIIDELGRGTSTHDGAAIAYASLEHLLKEIRCFTLFVTHYPVVTELERVYSHCLNYHMAYMLSDTLKIEDDELKEGQSASLIFLYRVIKGHAPKSYGLNVARMAEIPKSVIQEAQVQCLKMRKYSSSFCSRFLKEWHAEYPES